MHLIEYPDRTEAKKWLSRPTLHDPESHRVAVAQMLRDIKARGDAAVLDMAIQFDGHRPARIEVSPHEAASAARLLEADLKNAIHQAYLNIRHFHEVQHNSTPSVVETMPGVTCSRRSVAIERVGLYIPGGTAPLFSTVLMLAIPAAIAGCREVILCTPPQSDGHIHPTVLYAAQLCGVHRIFQVGGVQAIGAMAYGTESIPQVWKIFGPGNSWVTTAKQLVSLEGTGIDMPAGPSELAVIADASARADFIAADLLSQAEHGSDSQVLLVSDSRALIEAVQTALQQQLHSLPRRDFAAAALANSKALLVRDMQEGMDWINAYAPEHLIIQTQEPEKWAEKVVNAGSVFIGAYTPESAGDYASGTNHTLPTNGYARVSGGVSVESFVRKITFQSITAEGMKVLGPVVLCMARAEGLEAHARAVAVRLEGGNSN